LPTTMTSYSSLLVPPAGDCPVRIPTTPLCGSCGRTHRDRHPGTVGEHVVDGGSCDGTLDHLAEVVRPGPAFDHNPDVDRLVPAAHRAVDAQETDEIDVAGDRRLDPAELDAAGGGDVADSRRDARGEGMEQVLGR